MWFNFFPKLERTFSSHTYNWMSMIISICYYFMSEVCISNTYCIFHSTDRGASSCPQESNQPLLPWLSHINIELKCTQNIHDCRESIYYSGTIVLLSTVWHDPSRKKGRIYSIFSLSHHYYYKFSILTPLSNPLIRTMFSNPDNQKECINTIHSFRF